MMGQFLLALLRNKQKLAALPEGARIKYARSMFPCTFNLSSGCPSKQTLTICQHRYPSPNRSVRTQDRPAFHLYGASSAYRRGVMNSRLALSFVSLDFDATKTKNKRRRVCLKHQLSLQPLRRLALQVALNPMPNGRLLAQRAVVLQTKLSAMANVSMARLPVQLLARCLTTLLATKNTLRSQLKTPWGQQPLRRFAY